MVGSFFFFKRSLSEIGKDGSPWIIVLERSRGSYMLVWVLHKDGKRKTNNQVDTAEKEDTSSERDSSGNPSDQDTGRE